MRWSLCSLRVGRDRAEQVFFLGNQVGVLRELATLAKDLLIFTNA